VNAISVLKATAAAAGVFFSFLEVKEIILPFSCDNNVREQKLSNLFNNSSCCVFI
jgi:hypothetical protein